MKGLNGRRAPLLFSFFPFPGARGVMTTIGDLVQDIRNAKRETLWATQAQMAGIFEIDRTVATKHIGNILRSKEVSEKSNEQKMHIANSDKPIKVYSLDIILAVGYRANSGKAILFRQWATKTLRQHLVNGYTINRKRISQNYEQFLRAVLSLLHGATA